MRSGLKDNGPDFGLNADVTERGTRPANSLNRPRDRGKKKRKERDDDDEEIENLQLEIDEGCFDLSALRKKHFVLFAKKPALENTVEKYIKDTRPLPKIKSWPLRRWQQDLYGRLILAPEDRPIVFIVDVAGNKGKSWFARYYCMMHDNAQLIVPGRKADMAMIVKDDKKVFFFDCPRSKQGDFIQYDFLEELKNGYISSPKYESTNKVMEVPHVVVLMNEYPDTTKLSEDRYSVKVLSETDMTCD